MSLVTWITLFAPLSAESCLETGLRASGKLNRPLCSICSLKNNHEVFVQCYSELRSYVSHLLSHVYSYVLSLLYSDAHNSGKEWGSFLNIDSL